MCLIADSAKFLCQIGEESGNPCLLRHSYKADQCWFFERPSGPVSRLPWRLHGWQRGKFSSDRGPTGRRVRRMGEGAPAGRGASGCMFDGWLASSVVLAGTTSAQTDAVLQWLPNSAASAATGVPPEYIAAVIRVESGGDPNAVSSAGAIGLMQVMAVRIPEPGYFRRLWYDPGTNIMAGSTEIGKFLSSTVRSSRRWRAISVVDAIPPAPAPTGTSRPCWALQRVRCRDRQWQQHGRSFGRDDEHRHDRR